MRRVDDLIYDLGMNNGVDTAYYLSRGFRVVAVEAIPGRCEAARLRFAREIARGQLVVEPIGIAAERGHSTFYVVEGNDEFSSFDPELSRRDGLTATAVEVRTAPVTDLFERYGVPCYLKIDIEGYDGMCLDSLLDVPIDQRPRYVSVEAVRLDSLCRLWAAGYRQFKLIDQLAHNFGPLPMSNETVLGRLVRTVTHYRRMLRVKTHPDQIRFPIGSSGPFGEETNGEWQDLEPVAYEWLHRKMHQWHRGTSDVRSWCDFHAKLEAC